MDPMELVYEVSDENLKVLVAALHCLAQIGKELSLECDGASQLTLRVLNDAHSASGAVTFDRSFFSAVRVVGPLEAAPFVRCKVFARSCCNLFRTLKHVRGLQLSVALGRGQEPAQREDDEAEDEDEELECEELRWRLRCDFGVTKTHRMKVHASPIMRAVFHREACASRVVARQFHWASMLAHLHHSNEVAVTCSDAHVKLESYVPTAGDGKAHLHTETAVESAEFQEYALAPAAVGVDASTAVESAEFQEYALAPAAVGVDASVQLIFCLKEVRVRGLQLAALLTFCKASDIAEIAFFFNAAGSPVLFAAESTAAAKVSVEITLSTVTTFVPAASQTRSEDDDAASMEMAAPPDLFAERDSESSQSSSQQQQPRYLTHSSKRVRID
ncbi:hypothetical protein P43SY_001575 [Pythium insidiosum]|uniref:Cell cycle checkpoint control protein RAD9A n=1 Tax=Pythium insidiosum TaxID=114742 RepID=A0AAD5LJU8_PYTIN|nr:hypothetical protein P43SY_001575 [Pythium insidiosum]